MSCSNFVSAFVILIGSKCLCTQLCAIEPIEDPRSQVLDSSSARTRSKAFQEWFEGIGRAGIAKLVDDEDVGISLQAAWEVHKKLVKRVKPVTAARSDDVYDREELNQFLIFLKKKTKATVPDWWAESIVDVDVFPNEHHAFIGAARQKVTKSQANEKWLVTEGAELTRGTNTLVFSTGGKSIEFPDDKFVHGSGICFTGVVTDKTGFIATFAPEAGQAFKVARFEDKGNKPVWLEKVWAAGRTAGSGPASHRVELVTTENTLMVFGKESHGMYLEAFDKKTGKNLYRFCTCYWFNNSEGWKIK